jgi:hypothetical protein
MGFRFRRSFKVLPGMRVNLGKRGASITAGVRGAHITHGVGGTRATVGLPGTGVSYTQKVSSGSTAPFTYGGAGGNGFPLKTVITVVVLFVLALTLGARACLLPLALIAFIACTPWFFRKVRQSLRANQPPLPIPTHVGPVDAHASVPQRKVSSDAKKREAEEAQRDRVFRETERLASLLARYKCFYAHDDEMVGPVSLWVVREMIDSDLLSPDVQVILEGTDFLHTYVEQELKVAAPPGADVSALERRAKIQYFYYDRNIVKGPLSLLGIDYYIKLGRLPAEVQICEVGSVQWKTIADA